MDDRQKVSDQAAFVAARLDEDEALAKRGEEVFAIGWPDYQTYDSPELDDANRYLNRFGPARALREIAAGRVIIDLWRSAVRCGDWESGYSAGELSVLKAVIPALAAIWNGHPGYRQEWA